ncbi:MAG: hypothetical protein E7354_03700 [Clostridiales bacterium]|nr:hypothetical protein [Clostridiales bacterium]
MDTKRASTYRVQFIVVIACVVLAVCVLVGSVLAWLKRDYTRESEGLHIGTVAIEIFADGSNVTHTTNHTNGTSWECSAPYAIPTSANTTRTLNLKIRNTGTVDAIVRATIRVYTVDENNNITYLLGSPEVLSSTGVKIGMDTTGWYQALSANNQVASGYMFLSEKLEPYELNGETSSDREIPIISQITVPAGYENTEILVSVTIDAVSYSGNIYKKIYENSTTNVTPKTLTGDTRTYSEFTVPSEDFLRDLYPSGTTNLIPVPAFPFGSTIPCDVSGAENTGWLGWM